jgi:hypothetical protein
MIQAVHSGSRIRILIFYRVQGSKRHPVTQLRMCPQVWRPCWTVWQPGRMWWTWLWTAWAAWRHSPAWEQLSPPFRSRRVGLQRDIVHLSWPIAPSYRASIRGRGGGCGVSHSANEYSCAHHMACSPNKLLRSVPPYLTYEVTLRPSPSTWILRHWH